MANFHLTAQMISRQGGKSCVASLAYRSATKLIDQRTSEVWDYTKKANVNHVEILIPHNAPAWVTDLTLECRTSRQSAIQKFSDIIEAAERRKDSQVYREVEFSLPNELTPEQNIAWANEFVSNVFVKRGMVAVVNFHFDIDPKTGVEKPHCHALMTTRDLTEDGFSLKNRYWNSKELIDEAREQCAQYQNEALKEHGFDVRVTNLSYEARALDVDAQTKLGKNVREMTDRGVETDKQKIFDGMRLKNQFRIVKNPEIVFSIVTSKHSTFNRKDIAKVLNRYIDDAGQFQVLFDRLMNSKELVDLESSGIHNETQEPVFTTQEMLKIELNLVKTAETLSAQKTHQVTSKSIDGVITKHNEKLAKHGGLSSDQQAAIRHMLKGDQISSVIGFAGAGKTTCLEAAREAWEEAGYKIVGLAPTGKAADNMEGSGIRSMTIHKFLLSQERGRERPSSKTVLVLDEAGMVDSRRFTEVLSLVEKTGAKIVIMGDGNQLQAVEAGPALRLLMDCIKPVVLEKIVRQQIEWQRDATRLFGTLQTRQALELYQENGCFTTIQEKTPEWTDKDKFLDHFCLARQVSGRIWKEMVADFEQGSGKSFNPQTDFETLAKHQDFELFKDWKKTRQTIVSHIIKNYGSQEQQLKDRGVDVKALKTLVTDYRASPTPNSAIFKEIETALRQMSYEHIVDTRESTRQAMVEAWAEERVHDRKAMPNSSHIMLTFTNTDANKLNETARTLMRTQGEIKGADYTFKTMRIDEDVFGEQIITAQDRTFANGDRLLFTNNDNRLKVKNGNLGTIVDITQQKITVALDDDQGTLSFSPNLYPFIDNGWATTIHKAQGVTADHVKLLASFEQYRNLAYVGMSRHRYTLKVFASSLDFWRKEKIIDRLSRVQEKLSGYDYLDAKQIQEKLKEDTAILWHEQKLNQAKDFWAAIKVTAWDVFDKAFDRPQRKKGVNDEFLSFDDSEEMRSRDFFKDTSAPPESSFDLQRQRFEDKRLATHQEWCARLGFFVQHKRFPKDEMEISAAYWQGERLTAIEGRLYKETLAKGEQPDEKKLTLQARIELSKNQAVPDTIMAFGRASDLTQTQLWQFEQHALIHQDKTSQLPNSSDLGMICRAIKVHAQVMEAERGGNRDEAQVMPTKIQGTPEDASEKYPNFSTAIPDTYRTLVEQQAILTQVLHKQMDKGERHPIPIKANEIRDSCSERLQRMSIKVQETKAFIQEMKALELNRQNQKGIDFGP